MDSLSIGNAPRQALSEDYSGAAMPPDRLLRARTSRVPRYETLNPSSAAASRAARGSSRKRDTACELVLRRALWALGLRYRVDVRTLPGRPDIVFARERVVVFCDGDFWHGRDLSERLSKLQRGHNAPYWTSKISTNVARDRRHDADLLADDWLVLRFWETDIVKAPASVAQQIAITLRDRRATAQATVSSPRRARAPSP